MSAALAVLEVDRTTRRPENRILTAEQEVGLTVLMRGGVDHVGEETSDAEMAALPDTDVRRRARDCLVAHNQRLVHSLARHYVEQGLEYEDLFQHGVLGLLRAVRKFDPEMGNKFSTYATWWIRQAITRAIADEGSIIRVPVHMHEVMRKVANAERALQSRGRPAGAADVAVACDLRVEKVEEVRRLSRRVDSLDRVIGDGAHLGDLVGAAYARPSVEHQVVAEMHLEYLLSFLDAFPPRTTRILMGRIGLDGPPSTLEELGKELGVTRERVRQLEKKAFEELRAALTAARKREEEWDGSPSRRPAVGRREAAKTAQPQIARTAELGLDRLPEPEALLKPEPLPVLEPAALSGSEPDLPLERTPVQEGVTLRDRTDVAELPADAESDPQAQLHGPEDSAPPVPSGVGEPVRDSTVSQGRQYAADWEQARRQPRQFAGGVTWLAEYALLALGCPQLAVMLGEREAAAVVRAARERAMLDRPVVQALQLLARVLDALKDAEVNPEVFFDSPSDALLGVSPRTYLAARPLVKTESRLALRDALSTFVATLEPGSPGPPVQSAQGRPPEEPTTTVPAAPAEPLSDQAGVGIESAGSGAEVSGRAAAAYQHAPADTQVDALAHALAEQDARLRAEFAHHSEEASAENSRRLASARAEGDARLVRLEQEWGRRIRQEQQAGAERLRAAEREAESRLDALEAELLQRMDKALNRREDQVRHAAEQRIAHLREQHRQIEQLAQQRVRAAEGAVGSAAQQAEWVQQRAAESDARLREQSLAANSRLAQLEQRLAQAEAALVERVRTAAVVEQWAADRVATAEQRSAEKVAQVEHDAWVRISELQGLLAAARAVPVQAADSAESRSAFRDRWRRS
ncbi:sigma-70 family RNA polymerase sigma factor [Streptomyces sp. NPDC005078]